MALSIRRRRPAPIAVPTPRRGLRASAQRFKLKGKRTEKQGVPRRAWQDEAWADFDDVAELKGLIWWLGNVMAKLRIFPAVRDPNDPEAPLIPVSDPASGVSPEVAARAQAELDRLKGNLGGPGEIFRALNMNLEVAGEGYIIGWGPREVDILNDDEQVIGTELLPEQWGVYSVKQVTRKGMGHRVTYTVTDEQGDSKGVEIDEELDTIIRFWQRHPAWSLEADCNLRGCLSDCEALTLLVNSIKADAKGRASAGLLLMPNNLRGGDKETEPSDGEESATDPFAQDLYDAYVDPVENPASAAAVAPTIVWGEIEDLKEVRHITTPRLADERVLAKVEAFVERIARGMNAPVEATLGHKNTTFANAEQIDRDTFDDYLEPRCDLIVDVLAVAFLQPNLIEGGLDKAIAEQILVGYDPSRMISQPRPVNSADVGVEIGAIGRAAWRRAKGWSEDDAPAEGETPPAKQGFGAPTAPPETAPAAKPATPVAASANGHGLLLPIAAAKSTRNVGFDLMLLDRDLRSRLIVAADLALNRALERAGNRLRAKAGQTRTLAAAGKIAPVYVAATLGPTLVAAAGIADDDLISGEVWAGLAVNFQTWVAAAQDRALTLVAKTVTLSDSQREIITQRQTADRLAAWEWMRDQLHALAQERLYAPDPAVPDVGEHDPMSRVPAGLIRQTLARAGGATGITQVQPKKAALRASGDIYVAVNNDKPLGGVGFGELLQEVLTDGGAMTDAYEWVYGPAYRLHPFDPHETLDQEVFENFDADILVSDGEFDDYYYPGDHLGCSCDVAPIVVEPAALQDSAEAAGLTDLGDVPPPEGDLVDAGTGRKKR